MLDTFTDITQANAGVTTFDLGDVETDTVIDHRQPYGLFRAVQGNGDVFRLGVAFNIGQAFLHDAKQRDRRAIDQMTVEFVIVVGHDQAAALLEFCGELTDRRRQAQGVEQRGTQVVGEAANFANRFPQALRGVSQRAQALVVACPFSSRWLASSN